MRGDSKAPAARRAGFASSPAGDDAAGSVWPARPTSPDACSNTPSGALKPPTTVAHPHSNPAHAAVSHHTAGTHTGKLRPK